MYCSLWDSSIHGIFQARELEWVAISFSRGFSQPRDQTCVSCIASRRLYHLSHQGSLSTGEGNGKPLQYSCLDNPMNSMKRQKYRTLKDEFPRLVGVKYATGEEQRNSSRKNEEAEPKQKGHTVVDVSGGECKVWCCKEQYCIGTWNVRSMNQGKLEVVKQEMARVNVNILGISELRWTGMVNLTQMTIISTTVGTNPLEEME